MNAEAKQDFVDRLESLHKDARCGALVARLFSKNLDNITPGEVRDLCNETWLKFDLLANDIDVFREQFVNETKEGPL